jgi:adenylate cyclase
MNTGEAARGAGVRPATLRRWAREGLIPQYNGSWTPAAVGHARVVARVEAVETTLPDEARVIKTIGDEVMIVGSDPAAIVDWAVGFQSLQSERPLPRIGIHLGVALYRDGDYFGRDVNIASRVAARSAGGEVLVTRPVVEHAGSHLEFERIAEVKLKGFKEPTEIFIARLGGEEE